MATLEEDQKDNETKYRMRMVLQDLEENDVECVLWDNCASDTYLAQLQNNDTPVVVVINLARLGSTENNRRQICSLFSATRVLFNPPIKEVQELLESAKDRQTPITTTFSQPIPSQMSCVSNEGSLHNQTKVAISEIPDQPMGSIFVINCEVHKFETKYGWIYDGCTKCGSKPKPKDANNPNTLLCPSCRKEPLSLEPKMKLHYMVKDDSGSYSVIFWDQLAVQLLNMTALQLKLTLPENERTIGFPKELEAPVGKKLLVKLKVNEFNKKFPGSSISVTGFTVCEDLLDEFNATSVEDVDAVLGTPGDKVNIDAVTLEPEHNDDGKQNMDEQDISIVDLSQSVTQPPPKGKRKTNIKRNISKGGPSSVTNGPSQPNLKERLLKTIKQEK